MAMSSSLRLEIYNMQEVPSRCFLTTCGRSKLQLICASNPQRLLCPHSTANAAPKPRSREPGRDPGESWLSLILESHGCHSPLPPSQPSPTRMSAHNASLLSHPRIFPGMLVFAYPSKCTTKVMTVGAVLGLESRAQLSQPRICSRYVSISHKGSIISFPRSSPSSRRA